MDALREHEQQADDDDIASDDDAAMSSILQEQGSVITNNAQTKLLAQFDSKYGGFGGLKVVFLTN